MKKMLCLFLSIFCLIPFCPVNVSAFADDELSAPSAVLMEASSKTVLYAKNAHEIRPCASITKVMTLLLVMEALDAGSISLTDEVAASAHAASMGGSDIWLKEGEVMSVDDLLKATVIMSANDAAVVLAEYVAGTEDEFVSRMNARAAELGMEDTVFKNCNGLDEDGHVTSAYDVALMSSELLKHEKIYDYTLTWIDYVRNGETQLVNTNKLIRTYQGITGLKTGTTGKAGSCISATAKRGDLSLVSVVLGCTTTDQRFQDAAKLLDYGFASFCAVVPETPSLEPIPIKNGMEKSVAIEAESTGTLLVQKGKEKEILSEITLYEGIQAPVETGQTVGKITYSLDGEILCEVKVCATERVEKISFGAVFSLLLVSLFSF